MPQAQRARAAARRQTLRRLRIAGAVLVLAAAAAAAAVALTRAGDDGGEAGSTSTPTSTTATTRPLRPLSRAGSTVVPGAPDVALAAAPAAYRIVWRVESAIDDDTIEQLWVRRPFDSRLELSEGSVPGGAVAREDERSFGRLAFKLPESTPVVTAATPAVPDRDVRLDIGLAERERAGLVERREVRDVDGRRCQVLRTRLVEGALRRPSDDDHVDRCLDSQGLVIEEWEVAGGRPIRRRVALDVEVAPTFADAVVTRLPAVQTVPAKLGGGSVRRVTDDSSTPGPYYLLDGGPASFAYRGRYVVVPAQSSLADPMRSGQTQAATPDVWVRGADVVMLDQGGVLDQSDPFQYIDGTERLDLGPILGRGEALSGIPASEVRVKLPGGRYVRLYGSLPVADLAALARSIRQIEGGSLTFIDPPSP